MKRLAILPALALAFLAAQQPPQKKGPPPFELTAEQRRQVHSKMDELGRMLRVLQTKQIDADLLADVQVYEKAGRWLLEFPETFFNEDGFNQSLAVLDQGVERARALGAGDAPWVKQKGRKIHAYHSALDGSLQPYGLTVPATYDGTKPVRLYVWLHGRDQRLTESSFLYRFSRPAAPSATYDTEDLGQIILDCFGRQNNANHYAGEVDVFEAIAAVQKRYRIDPDRIILRGFSLGGAGAWHIALQYPDRFAAAEIGAGTWPRRSQMPGFPPHQQAVLHIWENITEWALNAFNLPLAAHDGDSDMQVASIPPPPPGTPTRGQLESSIRVREQLEKDGFPSEGAPDFLKATGTPAIFLISEKTGHSVSPLVRQRLNAFLKEWGDRGRITPPRVRFLTYTVRYNRCYWVSVDELDKHYERAEVDAVRQEGGSRFVVTTRNVARLSLRDTKRTVRIRIDGQELRGTGGTGITLEKTGSAWGVAKQGKARGLRKTHGLQGPIDDAFLDPFLLVRPTGTPWNEAANQQALRILARFDRLYARYFRAHPRIKDDKDVTEADLANYNIVLFGDPGSNRWIAKLDGKLPVTWGREAIGVGKERFPSAEHLPALVYPNPLHPSRYVVLNSGLTIDDREYQADYGMPRLGDYAVLKIAREAEVPEVAVAGLFDEFWRLPQ